MDCGGWIYVGEYLYKNLRATALLYAGLVALAVLGLRGVAARFLPVLRIETVSTRNNKLDCCLDYVVKRFAINIAAQLASRGAQGAGSKLRARSGNVGREQQVGAAPQRMPFRQRLGIGDVESGADAPGMKRINQCIRVHNRPARGIHQQSALPHKGKLARADEPARLRCGRKDQNHDFSLWKQAIQFAYGMDLGIGASAAGHAHHTHMKRLDHALDFLADAAVAHQENRLAGQFLDHDRRIRAGGYLQ